MTKITAQLNSLRIAPRKVRIVADLIKGMEARDAEHQLRFLAKCASRPLLKLIKSAIANAHHNAGIKSDEPLVIRDLRVDEGRTLKRFMPRARGRATTIRKRTSNILLVLEPRVLSKSADAKRK